MAFSIRDLFRLKPPASPPSRRTLGVEPLEDRSTPSVSFTNGVLTVTGTSVADQFQLQLKSGDATTLQVTDAGTTQEFSRAAVTQINVNGLGGDDILTVNFDNGVVGASGAGLPLAFNGGTGFNTLRIQGNPGGGLNTTIAEGSNRQAGTLTASLGGNTLAVTFSGTEALSDTSTGSLTVQASAGRDLIRLGNGPTVNGQSTNTIKADTNSGKVALNHAFGGSSAVVYVDEADVDTRLQAGDTMANVQGANADAVAMVPLTFANKSTVTIDTGGGDDVFSVASGITPAAGLTSLTFKGGAGTHAALLRDLPTGVTVTLNGVGQVHTSDDEIFVQSLYNDLLRRNPSNSEVDAWVAYLHVAGRAAVANGIGLSQEAQTVLVKDWYVQFLGRAAVNGEEQGWVMTLQKGASEELTLTGILSSAEFRSRADSLIGGTNSNQNYVRALYQVLLHRDPESQATVDAWVNLIATTSYQSLANAFVQTAEFRIYYVDTLYRTLLRRVPSNSEESAWAQTNLGLYALRASFAASLEFSLYS